MKKGFIIFLMIACLSFSIPITYAGRNDYVIDWGEPETGGDSIKVYISTELKERFSLENKTYYSQVIDGQTKYYYYDVPIVSELVEGKSWSLSIDQIIFNIIQLEKYATGYTNSTDKILGFLRGINSNYAEYFQSIINIAVMEWVWLAGGMNYVFIEDITAKETGEIPIHTYFANFVDDYSYNSATYGQFYDDSELMFNRRLSDPINPNNYYNKIDLIHMFATIDAMYKNTNNEQTFNENFQRDVAGWAGDLQTFVRHNLYKNNSIYSVSNLPVYNYNTNQYKVIDFGEFLGGESIGITSSDNTFSNEDMLADIDAANIAVHFLNEGNSLSQSIASYYKYINHDNSSQTNRYSLFIDSIAKETSSNASSKVDRFKAEIYKSMFLNSVGLNKGTILIGECEYYLLAGGFNLDLPPYSYRKYGADLFINYILSMSNVIVD